MRVEFAHKRFICRCSYEERSIPKTLGFKWDSDYKQWYTLDSNVALRLEACLDETAKNQINQCRIKVTPFTGGLECPPHLTLYDFQVTAVKFALERTRSYLALDPGLGKTPIAAVTLATLSAQKQTAAVYICPPFLTRNTEAEFLKWAPNIKTVIYDGVRKVAQCLVIPDSIITRAEVLRTITEFANFCKQMHYETVLIVDEVHRFKGDTAQRTQAMFGSGAINHKGITQRFDRNLFLSGTPMPNRPIELFTVLSAAAPETIDFMSKFQYAKHYCAAFKNHFGWDYTGASNVDELAKRILGTFMLRYRKSEVLKELPPKTEEIVVFDDEMEPQSAALGHNILNKYSTEDLMQEKIRGILEKEDGEILYLATYRRQLGIEKIPATVKYIKYVLEETSDAILIFAIHKDVITRIAKELESYSPLVITGDTAMGRRNEIVKLYQTSPTHRVFIGNIQAAGTGFTLTKATRVIFAEFSFTPADNDQASDRAHRIGQKDNVLVEYLVYRNSVDKAVIETILAKKKITEKI